MNQVIKKKFIKKKIFDCFVYLIFLFFLILGLNIYKDYGISVDEPFQRTSGYYWYIWILENFFNGSENINSLKNNFEKMEWAKALKEGAFIQYGSIFDTFLVYIENYFDLDEAKNIYQTKHLANFFIFYLSSIFFFFLIRNRFQNNIIPLIGYFFYISSPRIFGNSFYNCKDIIFMSLLVIAIYFAIKLLKKIKYKNIILFSLFLGLATSIRVMGVFYLLLFITFFLIQSYKNKVNLQKKIFSFLVFGTSYFFFTYIFWPYLWEDPINNFFDAFTYFKKYGWQGSVFYFGEYIKANNLPWHYPVVWIFISMPFIYIAFLLFGIFYITKKFFENFISSDKPNFEENFWKSDEEKIDVFMLSSFLCPLFIVILLNSSLYNGWRQLYFIYPFLIYLSINGLSKIYYSMKKLKFLFVLLIFFSIFLNAHNIYKLHPFQNVYFNFIVEKNANKLFVIDYWGLANQRSLEKIIIDSNNKKIDIGTASFTPFEYSRYMFDKEKVKNIIFSGNANLNQDYIFTNYVFDSNPKYQQKFNIPKKYKKIFETKKGNIIINEVYKKTDY